MIQHQTLQTIHPLIVWKSVRRIAIEILRVKGSHMHSNHFLFVACQISFFENVAAMTLQYLDSLVQRDDMAKSQFFRGLYKVMSKLPKVSSFLQICFSKFSISLSRCFEEPTRYLGLMVNPPNSTSRSNLAEV